MTIPADVTLEQAKRLVTEASKSLEMQKDLWDPINRLTVPLKRRGEQNHFSEGIRKMFDEPKS